MAKEKNPKWENEMWNTTIPPDDIPCKDCIFRLQDIEVAGEVFKRHTYGECRIYESPKVKPHEVLWDGKPCEFYEQEKKRK